jgi:hypothetical protein
MGFLVKRELLTKGHQQSLTPSRVANRSGTLGVMCATP